MTDSRLLRSTTVKALEGGQFVGQHAGQLPADITPDHQRCLGLRS
jgi:hypothetical protein